MASETFPPATVLVAMSSRMGFALAVGIAIDNGFVPKMGSIPP